MSLETLWLYGSVARGTFNDSSDLDILHISDDPQISEPYLEAIATLPLAVNLAIKNYSWSEIEAMSRYGSLFLLHLSLEGRALFHDSGSIWLTEILDNLPAYTLGCRDVEGFRTALEDARESLADGGDPAFELGVIATIIRHASILTCYLLGVPTFDRVQSITTAFTALGMNERAPAAIDIYEYRLSEARGIPPRQSATRALAQTWRQTACEFIDRLEDIA